MDKKIIDYLEQLELSEYEIKLYFIILEVSPKSVRELAHILEVNPTTAYLHIERLIEKELVMKVIRGAKTLIVPNKPDDILNILVNKKVESANAMQKNLSTITGALTAKYSLLKDIDDAEVKYYKGKLGIKKIYEEALKAEEIRSYANLSEIDVLNPENFAVFDNAFKDNPKLKIYEIVEDSPNSRRQTKFLSQNPRYFYKFIPSKVKLSSVDTLIYNGKVSIINIQNSITGFVFNNNEYYNNSKELFDFMWEVLPEEK